MNDTERPRPVRIKCTDTLGNVTHLYQRDGLWRCAGENGTALGFSYAGFGKDEMEVKFALEDAEDVAQILRVVRHFGNPKYTYTVVDTFR